MAFFDVSTIDATPVSVSQVVCEGGWFDPSTFPPIGNTEDLDFQWGYNNFSNNTASTQVTSSPSVREGTYTVDIDNPDPDRTITARAHSVNSGNIGGNYVTRRTFAQPAVWNSGPTIGSPTQLTIPVSGTVTPNTSESTGSVKIQYRVSGGGAFLDGPTIATGLTGPATQAVSGTLTGLSPGTSYDIQLQIVRTTVNATILNSALVVASTLPAQSIATGAATEITQVGVKLNGTVNPNSNLNFVKVLFQYGLTSSYGSSTGLLPKIGFFSGTDSISFYINALNLTPNTMYHFRAQAITSELTVSGADETFTTASFDPTVAVF